jgi:hypothetical protein
MSLVRIVNCLSGGKVLINLTRVSTIELKDNTLKLNFSNKIYKDDTNITLKCDTRDEANIELNKIYNVLNKYYK